jgi:hypothetical protein
MGEILMKPNEANVPDMYDTLFEKMSEGFTLCEVIYDCSGNPSDFRYLELNKAYGYKTYKFKELTRRCMKELY